jgi:DNA modification methylase
MNQLILGDNLEILRNLPSESVDLIYIDPPFFSNRNYEVIWGDKGEVRSFEDRWSGGMMQYIGWLKERVEEMHRLLKPTGSFFLHCDWHANAEIKVYILNKIFGENNFRGEITWQRTNAHNKTSLKLAPLSDTIWYYTKSDKFNYNLIYTTLTENYELSAYRYEDEKGKYRLSDLTGSGIRTGQSGEEWKGYNPTKRNRHWAIPNKAIEDLIGKNEALKLNTFQKLEILLENGLIEFSKNEVPSFKRYLNTSKGNLIGNIWTDILNVQSQAKERIGYPTQKPEALLARIIKMASNEGDMVLDAFVGGGTTVVVADKLNRQWIGIDQSVAAIKVTEMRLNLQQTIFSQPFILTLHKYDYDTLRYKDAFQFETWIVGQYGGVSNTKQRSDFGLDGKTREGLPIQVKRSDNIGRNVIDNFKSAIERFDKALFDKNKQNRQTAGLIIAFSFGKGAIEEVARLKTDENVIIQLIKVEDIVPIAKKPTIQLSFKDLGADAKGMREVEFTAIGNSEAGIEFYAWDFNYTPLAPLDRGDFRGFKPEVLLDKSGIQTQKFKPGLHHIAVKTIDNDGLEALEVIKLKVNGVVKVG